MKILPIIALTCLFTLRLSAEDSAKYSPESRNTTEVFSSTITKVYSFTEGDVSYYAYVVTYKDHEVVLVSSFSTNNAKTYAVGDVVRCQMLQMAMKVGDTTRTQVTFSLKPAPEEEAERLERFRAEIETRRAKRQPVGTQK